MHTRGVALAALLASAVAGPAWAHEPGAGPMTHGEIGAFIEDMAGQMRALGDHWRGHFGGPSGREQPLISLMLSHRDELALTPAQVQALEHLRTEFQKDAIRREAEIRIAETDVASLLEAELVDMAKVESKVREAEKLRADLRVARLRVIEEGKAQLTPEQRSKLAALAARPGPPAGPPRPMGPRPEPGRSRRM